MERVIWFATADSRDHLMRAHLMRRRLAERGIPVYVVTTSHEGIEFLNRFGTPAALLEGDARIAFDDRQNLDLVGTARRLLHYLSNPARLLEGFDWLRTLGDHALCVVNDFHPALLLGGFLQGDDLPIVHVHGSYQWRAMGRPFRQPVGSWVNPVYERLLRRLRHAGVARIVHRPLAAFRADWTASDHVELPPLVPHADGRVGVAQATGQRPTGAKAGARNRPQVAAYLNPYFRDPDVPRAIEGATERLEADLEGVAERFTDRTGWQRREPGFAGRAARADLLVSAPATDMIGLSRTYGLPLLMVLSNRPEQRRNARQYLSASTGPPRAAVELAGPDLAERLSTCAASLLDADNPAAGRNRVDDVQAVWSRAVATIVERLKSRPVRSYPVQRQIIDGSEPMAGGRRSN